jgi:hypothetical protein
LHDKWVDNLEESEQWTTHFSKRSPDPRGAGVRHDMPKHIALKPNCEDSNLSRRLFRYGVGRILFTGFKDVFKSPTVLGRASITNSSTDIAGTASKRSEL